MGNAPVSGPLALVLGGLAGLVIGHLVFSGGPGRRVLAGRPEGARQTWSRLATNPIDAPWRVRAIERGVWYVYDGDEWIGSVTGGWGEYTGARGLGSPVCGPFDRLQDAAGCVYQQAVGG